MLGNPEQQTFADSLMRMLTSHRENKLNVSVRSLVPRANEKKNKLACEIGQ